MAVKKVIQIAAETAEATKDIKKLFNELLEKQVKADEQQEKLNEEVKDLGTTAKKSEKGINSISKGFKGLGLAIKAAGIGLVIALLGTLKEVFFQNQKVADAFATVMETVSIIFNEVVEVFTNVIQQTGKSTKGLEALGKVVMGLLNLAIIPFKLAIMGIALSFKKAQLAWEQSFFGDKDPDKILTLVKDINELNKGIEQAGKDAIQSGKDIYENFGDAAGAIGSIVEGTIEGISNISVKGAYESAKANVQLKNNALLAAAEQGRLVEIYDRQAEKLRQIRDNELISIKERQKANDALGDVLEKQEKAMLAQADLQIAAAQAAKDKNNSIENQVALTEALANREGILAQIEGFRSEQDVNRNSLIRERLDLKNAEIAADAEIELERRRFLAEQIQDEELKLETLGALLEEERELEAERLQAKVDQYKQGTQARLDAEIEMKEFLHNNDMQITENEIALSELRISQAEKEAEAKARMQQELARNIGSALGAISQLFDQSSAASKAAAIAEIAIGTGIGFINALDIAQKSAKGTGPAAAFAFPIFYASQVAAVLGAAAQAKSILSTAKTKGGGGAGSVSAPSRASAPPPNPNFNIVGNSQANQLAGALNQNDQPVRAYVVSRNMSSQQEMDRNIRQTASVG
jgi:hypothetical protein